MRETTFSGLCYSKKYAMKPFITSFTLMNRILIRGRQLISIRNCKKIYCVPYKNKEKIWDTFLGTLVKDDFTILSQNLFH